MEKTYGVVPVLILEKRSGYKPGDVRLFTEERAAHWIRRGEAQAINPDIVAVARTLASLDAGLVVHFGTDPLLVAACKSAGVPIIDTTPHDR